MDSIISVCQKDATDDEDDDNRDDDTDANDDIDDTDDKADDDSDDNDNGDVDEGQHKKVHQRSFKTAPFGAKIGR